MQFRLADCGAHHTWTVAHCCQIVWLSPDQTLPELLEAAAAGAQALLRPASQPGIPQPRLCTHDELAARRLRRNSEPVIATPVRPPTRQTPECHEA